MHLQQLQATRVDYSSFWLVSSFYELTSADINANTIMVINAYNHRFACIKPIAIPDPVISIKLNLFEVKKSFIKHCQ